jgi:broad specificity phosphatase PhoE
MIIHLLIPCLTSLVVVLLLSSVLFVTAAVSGGNTQSSTMMTKDSSSSSSSSSSAAADSCPSNTKTTTVRFYLVRHGETIANNQGLVVGQWDSPLSTLGEKQAKALGSSSSSIIQSTTTFWKYYSSDLGRTKQTAKLISDNVDWIYDQRIREIAKGARQEYPKSWDYQRAIDQRRLDGKDIPLMESSMDAWKRIVDFMISVIIEAQQQGHYGNNSTAKNVLVVSHAGTLRTLLQRMVPQAHPSLQHIDDPSRPPDDSKRLSVPNTSVTVIDVTPKPTFFDRVMKQQQQQQHDGRLGPSDRFFPYPNGTSKDKIDLVLNHFDDYFETKVIEFMSTKHLDGINAKATSNDE